MSLGGGNTGDLTGLSATILFDLNLSNMSSFAEEELQS